MLIIVAKDNQIASRSIVAVNMITILSGALGDLLLFREQGLELMD